MSRRLIDQSALRRREWNICAVSTALKSLPRSEGGFLFRKSAVGDPVGTADNHLSRNRLSSNQRQVLEVKEMAAALVESLTACKNTCSSLVNVKQVSSLHSLLGFAA